MRVEARVSPMRLSAALRERRRASSSQAMTSGARMCVVVSYQALSMQRQVLPLCWSSESTIALALACNVRCVVRSARDDAGDIINELGGIVKLW